MTTDDQRAGAALFRKKPVVISAMQFTGTNFTELERFVGGDAEFRGGEMIIATLEGAMRAAPRDWIIKGVKGEFYPCKPDIFAATYEPAESRASDKREGEGKAVSGKLDERWARYAAKLEAGINVSAGVPDQQEGEARAAAPQEAPYDSVYMGSSVSWTYEKMRNYGKQADEYRQRAEAAESLAKAEREQRESEGEAAPISDCLREVIQWADLLLSNRSREVGEDFEVHPTVRALEAHERLCQWIREHAESRASDDERGRVGLLVTAFKAAWLEWLHAADVMKIDRDAALHRAISVYLQHAGHTIAAMREGEQKREGEARAAGDRYPGQQRHDLLGIIRHASWSEARKVNELLALMEAQRQAAESLAKAERSQRGSEGDAYRKEIGELREKLATMTNAFTIASDQSDHSDACVVRLEMENSQALRERDEALRNVAGQKQLTSIALDKNEQCHVKIVELTKERDEARGALEACVQQIEDDAESLEGEYGRGRCRSELIAAGEMPKAWTKAKEVLGT